MLQTLSRLLFQDRAPRSWVIDPRDEMLRYCAWQNFGERTAGLVQYFYSGWLAATVYEPILRWQQEQSRPDPQREEPTILDFASGYGRVTRFLLSSMRPDQIFISEIQPEAIAVQRELFGVGGFPSTHEPEALEISRQFDAVFAASLFSHLPRHRFESWIEKLGGLVAPGGLFVFSVHDESVLLAGRSMPESGIYFEDLSESDALELSEYGSTWVSEEFVARTLQERLPYPHSYLRVPRGIWHFQDLYVVIRQAEVDFSDLFIPRHPEGYLEGCQQYDDGTLQLSGWAVCHQSDTLPRVRVYLNEELVATTLPDGVRPDVAAANGRPAGWEVACSLPANKKIEPGDSICVLAEDETGCRGLIHLATVQATAFKMAARNHEFERDQEQLKLAHALADHSRVLSTLHDQIGAHENLRHRLTARIRAMEASKFWKLRSAWFKIKKRLGLASSETPGAPLPELDP